MKNSKDWELILCTGAEHLEEEFVRTGYSLTKSERNYDGSRKFANSDVYTRLADVERLQDQNVCILQSFTSSGEESLHNFSTGDRIIEVLQILDILKNPCRIEYKDSATRVGQKLNPPKQTTLLALHLPFSKQDQVYKTGESNACRVTIKAFYDAGVDQIVTVDPHVPQDFPWFRDYLESKKIIILSMYERVIKEMEKRRDFEDIVFVSTPGKRRSPIGIDLRGIDKERINTYEVLFNGEIDEKLKGKSIFLIDDMTISGTTFKKARKFLLSKGIKDVYGWITHALPYELGKEENLRRLVEAFDEKLFVSNTVRSQTFQKDYPYCCYSCVPMIIEEFLVK